MSRASSKSPVPGLIDDLAAERAELVAFLATKPDSAWTTMTPAEGWTIHDQVAHLAFFDQVTRLAVADPAAFERFRDELSDLQSYVDAVGERHAHLGPAEKTAWWQQEGAALQVAAREADPQVRVPWFGPAMSLASKLTARIMETWAHGQDIHDALGSRRAPTERLRHVARIGVLAFANSFGTRGLEVPRASVLVDLEAPDGSRWVWGEPDATDVVRGAAEDFCLVVTQRRHRDDTGLEVVGGVASQWMNIAQAFAGPAGRGRLPGQVHREMTPSADHRPRHGASGRGETPVATS